MLAILEGTRTRFTDRCVIIIHGPTVAAYADQSERIRAAGWNHSEIGAWTLFHTKDGREVSVGIFASMRANHFGVLFNRDTDPAAIAIILDRYQRVTGTAWRGTPGTTACAAIRSSWGNSRYQPLWNEPRRGSSVGPLVWQRELGRWERDWGWVHDFDANSAYLGAAISADLPWSLLHHTGAQMFDEALPGYWVIQLDTSTLEQLADPARPPVLPPGRVRDSCAEVTTPYARFLRDELGDRLEIVDSWTAQPETYPGAARPRPAGSRILRTWGQQLRDARAAVEAMPPGPLRDLLLAAVKRSYKDAVGATQREVNGRGMRVHRAIWGHTIVDSWRATMLRTAGRVRKSAGIWPLAIRTDSLTYPDCTDNPEPLLREIRAARVAKVGSTGLGGWRHTGVMTTEGWTAAHPMRKVRARRG